MLLETLLISIVMAFATAIQSLVGFGMALFAVPLLLLLGVDLSPAVFIVLSISLCSSLIGVRRLRAALDFKRAAGASLLRAIGVIPGYATALALEESSPANIKAGIAFAVGLGVAAQARGLVLRRREGTEAVEREVEPSKRAEPFAFLSSGYLMGWLGMGGPPLVFWLLSGRQDPKTTRSFLYAVYILTIPFQLSIMIFHDPSILSSTLPVLMVAVPTSLLTSMATLRFGDELDVDRLQWLSLLLLTLLTLKALADWLQYMWG